TAVFCGGDIKAKGAHCAADEMGRRVPQDVSVIGYDNLRNARFFTPSLKTIKKPKESLGETSFNMILDRIFNNLEES
ncbi:substrate-binding domain-containing protein, partial [Salmonella enterica subsp. enterica serovar Infantis]